MNPADGLQSTESVKNSYDFMVDVPDDEWWDSLFGTDRSDSTGDRALSYPRTLQLGSIPLSRHSRRQSLSSHPLSNPHLPGDESNTQAIESSTDYLNTVDTQTEPRAYSNDLYPSEAIDTTGPHDILGIIGMDSASQDLWPDNKAPPDRPHGISTLDQPQSRALTARSNEHEANCDNFLFGLGENFLRSNAPPVNRAECFTRRPGETLLAFLPGQPTLAKFLH